MNDKKLLDWLKKKVECLLSFALAATQWSNKHVNSTGTRYTVGTLVWYQGNVYKCKSPNDGIVPTNTFYWELLGKGWLLSQEQADWLATEGPSFIRNKPDNLGGGITEEIDPLFTTWLAGNPLSGFLTSETDPIFQSWLATNPLNAYYPASNPNNYITLGQVPAETDPIFTASPAGSISNTNISNWNTSFGWGNHASVGYLLSETDPIFNAWLNNNDNEPKFVVKNKYIVVPLFGNATPQTLAGIAYSINGATTRNFSDTNLYTRTPSLGLLTTAVAGNVAQTRQTPNYFSLNSGFDVYIKFGSNENANLSGIRSFVGISNSNGVQTNVEPNTLLNTIGFCRLSTSNNWSIIHNDNAGIAVVTDLGSNFPANTLSTDLYLARIRSLSSTSVEITTYRLNTTDVDVRIISTELPSSSTPLCLRWWVTNNANASIVGIDFMGSYLIN